MGLDNYPEPYPCKVLESKGELKIAYTEDRKIICEETNCPFRQNFSWIIGFFGTYCWIRGKVYEKYVENLNSDFSLYEDMDRERLEELYSKLVEVYGPPSDEARIADALKGEKPQVEDLIRYLETLLSIDSWDGELKAWY
jgi:hypothetical protein